MRNTYIVLSSPQLLSSSLDGVERLSWRGDVPELDGTIVTAGGEVVLLMVAPVKVVDARHVCCDITRRRGWFLAGRNEGEQNSSPTNLHNTDY